jgi:energy-coupling factor transport system ATP-binding protein
MKEDSAVCCEGIEFSYDLESAPVLRGVDLDIAKGSFAVIAGPSGAGKSTLIRTFNNVIPQFFRGPFSGTRWVAGAQVEKQPIAVLARKIGMVFQDFEQQLFSTSVILDLSFAPENFCIPPDEMRRRIKALLDVFHLTHLKNREPSSLSGGEKQKLAIASVLAYRPEILVLDEPTTDLDPDSRDLVLQVIPQLKEWVDTLIVVEHEMEHVQTADRIFLLSGGKIHSSGSPTDILTRSSILKDHSLAPLDLVRVQEALGMTPRLLSPDEFARHLEPRRLRKIDAVARTQSKPVVEIADLSFRYHARDSFALENVSLEVREGEFAAVIGHNGSGKSTLLKHLNGLQHPQKGNIKILGKDVREWGRKELSRSVGLVFQNPDHQIFEETVRQEVEFGPRRFGFSDDVMNRNVSEAIETMALSEQAGRDPFQLSKGERQRVAVASILSVQPDILVLDEPTTGLDDQQQRYLLNLLRRLNSSGKTVIIVTHALRLVAEYCNYVVLLDRGRVAAEGHPREVLFSRGTRLPPLLELSRSLEGNALTVDEFINSLTPAP